jgi:hypothetical protein
MARNLEKTNVETKGTAAAEQTADERAAAALATTDVVTVDASRCRCGSTARKRYYKTVDQHYSGITAAGKPYNKIIRRWTRCSDCGQARIDKTYENVPQKKVATA